MLAQRTEAVRTTEVVTPHYDPRLVEEAVLLAADAATASERTQFRRERDAVYEIPVVQARESSFRALDVRWFARFQISQPLLAALREHPSIAGAVSKCFVLPARSAKEEGADLHENREAGSPPTLVIRLRPQTLLASAQLFALLRRELLHVTDMLDPHFGYERDLPDIAGGATYENLIRARYRVVWNTTIDGRLAAQGRLPRSGAERSFQEFQATFGSLCADPRKHFDDFFRNHRPRHRDIVSFAISPGSPDSASATARGVCPLCQLPTAKLHGEFSPEVASILSREFAARDLRNGICRQCLDLYESQLTLREKHDGSTSRPSPSPKGHIP